jgi:hypothetical protein
MKIRGHRECKECGTRWSYYETGDVACPNCGSLHSVGLENERSLHTATSSSLDLAPIRNDIDGVPLRQLTDRITDRCRTLTREYGFIDAGRLQPLDDTYLAAMELHYAASELARRMGVTDDEEWYVTELLRADEGSRPGPDAVPETLRATRGLAYANAVREYRSDLRTYLGENPAPATDGIVERLGDHVKRVRALDGDVPASEAETIVAAARDLQRYLTEGDETALVRAGSRLDSLA